MGCRFSTRVRRPVLRLIRCIARAPVTGRCSRFLRRLRFLSARSSGGGRRSTWGWAPAGIWGGPAVGRAEGSGGGVGGWWGGVGAGWDVEGPGGASAIGQPVYVIYDNGSARADASPAV